MELIILLYMKNIIRDMNLLLFFFCELYIYSLFSYSNVYNFTRFLWFIMFPKTAARYSPVNKRRYLDVDLTFSHWTLWTSDGRQNNVLCLLGSSLNYYKFNYNISLGSVFFLMNDVFRESSVPLFRFFFHVMDV